MANEASNIFDVIKKWADENPNVVNGLLAGGAVGGLGGALLSPSGGSPDETAGQRFKRRLKNALILGGMGAAAGAAIPYAWETLTNAGEKVQQQAAEQKNQDASIVVNTEEATPTLKDSVQSYIDEAANKNGIVDFTRNHYGDAAGLVIGGHAGAKLGIRAGGVGDTLRAKALESAQARPIMEGFSGTNRKSVAEVQGHLDELQRHLSPPVADGGAWKISGRLNPKDPKGQALNQLVDLLNGKPGTEGLAQDLRRAGISIPGLDKKPGAVGRAWRSMPRGKIKGGTTGGVLGSLSGLGIGQAAEYILERAADGAMDWVSPPPDTPAQIPAVTPKPLNQGPPVGLPGYFFQPVR